MHNRDDKATYDHIRNFRFSRNINNFVRRERSILSTATGTGCSVCAHLKPAVIILHLHKEDASSSLRCKEELEISQRVIRILVLPSAA